MLHIDWESFMWGMVAWACLASIGAAFSKACDRMIDYHQRKLDEKGASDDEQ